MKNCNVILGLLVGYVSRFIVTLLFSLHIILTPTHPCFFRYMIAGLSSYQGNSYVDSSKISEADWVTFLWTTTFPLGFYPPAVVPLLIAYMVTTVETVGDISATYEVSDLDATSPIFYESIQGGLLSDSFSSLVAGLCTTMPNTSFSQNNGVIALVRRNTF